MGKKSSKKGNSAAEKAKKLENAFKHATDIDETEELNPNVKKIDKSLLNDLFSDVGSLGGSKELPIHFSSNHGVNDSDASTIDDYLTLERASINTSRSGFSSSQNSFSIPIPKEVAPEISNSSSSQHTKDQNDSHHLGEDILPEVFTKPFSQKIPNEEDTKNQHAFDDIETRSVKVGDKNKVKEVGGKDQTKTFINPKDKETNSENIIPKDSELDEPMNRSYGDISCDQVSGLQDYKSHEDDFLIDKLKQEQHLFNVRGVHHDDRFEDVTDEFELYKELENDVNDFEDVKREYYDNQAYTYIFCGILFLLLLVLIGLILFSHGV